MDKDKVNAELRKRFGDTVTRQQLFDYRTETGVYPVWIRRDESLRVGRGLYRIPGASAPVSRPVLPTPFDEGLYDEAPAKPAPAPAPKSEPKTDVGDKLVVATGTLHFHRCTSCGVRWGCRKSCDGVENAKTVLETVCRRCGKGKTS